MTTPAGPVRHIAALGKVMQLAYVPSDFDAALRYWTETIGAGPFYRFDHVAVEGVKVRGVETQVDFSMALGYWGDLQIELIQQHCDTPSVYNSVAGAGQDGLHHVCILVDSLDEARSVCEAVGAEIVQETRVPGGCAIYVDSGGGPGTIVEIAEFPQALHDMFAFLREQARGWDGSDPVRRFD